MTTKDACRNAETGRNLLRITSALNGIGGWMAPDEGFALHELARLGDGDGAVVELGSFMGLSTCWIASGLRERGGGVVYAVDTFAGVIPTTLKDNPIHHYGSTYERFESNLRRAGLWELVRPMRTTTAEAGQKWRGGPVRFLFIDAGHDYADIDADLRAWAPHLAPDSVVAVHDVGVFDGVTKRYDEMLADGYTELAAVSSLRVCSGAAVEAAVG